MPGGRERNVVRWELRVALLREQIARLDERLARMGDYEAAPTPPSSPVSAAPRQSKRDELLSQRAELARQLDSLGPDPRAKMG